jgi:hypothetical protein
VVRVALKSAETAGPLRYALPALLAVGGIATLGGASSLIMATGVGFPERLRRISRIRRTQRKKQ